MKCGVKWKSENIDGIKASIWHSIYVNHANNKTNTHEHEHIDKKRKIYCIMILQMSWFMGEHANHANIYFPNEIEKKNAWKRSMKNDNKIKWKTKFWVGKIFSISIKLQIFTDMYVILSLTHTYTLTHNHKLTLFFLSLSHISPFLITFLECNKILSFVSFSFNDAMKYASNACYLPAINVHVSFFVFFLFLLNNLTLIDSVRILFHDSLTQIHTVYSVHIDSNKLEPRIHVKIFDRISVYFIFFGQQYLKCYCISTHPRIWSKPFQYHPPSILLFFLFVIVTNKKKSHHLSLACYFLYRFFFY